MGEITLIRHGQANSAAQDEDSYDRLSELGHQQSAWLGAHLRAHEAAFDRVLTGTQRRHRQTLAAMGDMGADADADDRLNEMDYYTLSRALQDRHGVPLSTPEGFAAHFPQVLDAWNRAEIEGRESFAAFEARIAEVLQAASQPGVRVLCITSGGVIGTVLRVLLNLDLTGMAQVLLPIRNSSIHRVQVAAHGTLLSGFNATPHLDAPDRAFARTTY